MKERPWLKLWRREEGTYAQLPLLARALHCQILKAAHPVTGRIAIGDRDPADAIAYRFGADRADRRALKKYLPLLLAEGCLRVEAEELICSGWAHRNGSGGASTEPRSDHDRATIAPRSDHDRATIAPRSPPQTHAKPAKSHERKIQEEEEEKEEEKEGEVDPPKPPAATSPIAHSETEHREARVALRRAWSDAWAQRTGGPAPPAMLADVARLAGWLVDYRRRTPERALAELAGAAIQAFFAAKTAWIRPRLEWFAEDPGRWLEHPAKAGQSAIEAFDAEMIRLYREATAARATHGNDEYNRLLRERDEWGEANDPTGTHRAAARVRAREAGPGGDGPKEPGTGPDHGPGGLRVVG